MMRSNHEMFHNMLTIDYEVSKLVARSAKCHYGFTRWWNFIHKTRKYHISWEVSKESQCYKDEFFLNIVIFISQKLRNIPSLISKLIGQKSIILWEEKTKMSLYTFKLILNGIPPNNFVWISQLVVFNTLFLKLFFFIPLFVFLLYFFVH